MKKTLNENFDLIINDIIHRIKTVDNDHLVYFITTLGDFITGSHNITKTQIEYSHNCLIKNLDLLISIKNLLISKSSITDNNDPATYINYIKDKYLEERTLYIPYTANKTISYKKSAFNHFIKELNCPFIATQEIHVPQNYGKPIKYIINKSKFAWWPMPGHLYFKDVPMTSKNKYSVRKITSSDLGLSQKEFFNKYIAHSKIYYDLNSVIYSSLISNIQVDKR